MKKTRSFLDNTYEFLSRRPVYHGLFWVVLFGLMRWLDQGNEVETWFALGNEFVQLFFYAILVYFNLLYLIPNYLARHAFVYFGLILASCAIITPIEVLVLYLKFADQSAYRESLVDHQVLIFWGNVVVTVISTVLRVIMDWWRYQNEKQVLMTQTMQSELRFLKSQINPHFLFNSFNTLITIIEENPKIAVEYVEHLSDFYRSIMAYRERDFITVQEEMDLVRSFFFLLKKRYETGLFLHNSLNGLQGQVMPLTLQMLVENAVKHNVISADKPLVVEIFSENDGYITVRNNIRRKIKAEPSTHFGLQSLIRRYQLLGERPVLVEDNAAFFTVKVPV